MDGFVIDQVLQLIQDLIQIAVKFYFEKDEAKKVNLDSIQNLLTLCPDFN